MSDLIQFFVPGLAAAQGRPRSRVIRMGRRHVPQIYNPHNADEWKARVQIIARPFIPVVPIIGPVRFAATFLINRPKDHYLKKGSVLKPDAPLWHFIKPDGDNFAKAILDALTDVKMWVDDSQVCDQRIQKIYLPDIDDIPGCFVTIQQIETKPEIPELCPTFEFQKKSAPTPASQKLSRNTSTSQAL